VFLKLQKIVFHDGFFLFYQLQVQVLQSTGILQFLCHFDLSVDHRSFEVENIHDHWEVASSDGVGHHKQMNWLNIFHFDTVNAVNSCDDAVLVAL
jgi:hypothetical protein